MTWFKNIGVVAIGLLLLYGLWAPIETINRVYYESPVIGRERIVKSHVIKTDWGFLDFCEAIEGVAVGKLGLSEATVFHPWRFALTIICTAGIAVAWFVYFRRRRFFKNLSIVAVGMLLLVGLWAPIGSGGGYTDGTGSTGHGKPPGVPAVHESYWGVWCYYVEVEVDPGFPFGKLSQNQLGPRLDFMLWRSNRTFFYPERLALTIVCTAGIAVAWFVYFRRRPAARIATAGSQEDLLSRQRQVQP